MEIVLSKDLINRLKNSKFGFSSTSRCNISKKFLDLRLTVKEKINIIRRLHNKIFIYLERSVSKNEIIKDILKTLNYTLEDYNDSVFGHINQFKNLKEIKKIISLIAF